MSDDVVFVRPYMMERPLDQVFDFLCAWSGIGFVTRTNPECLSFRLDFNFQPLSQVVGYGLSVPRELLAFDLYHWFRAQTP